MEEKDCLNSGSSPDASTSNRAGWGFRRGRLHDFIVRPELCLSSLVK